MTTSPRFATALLAWALLCSALTDNPVDGCAIAPPPNGGVALATETAIIVWDPGSRTQHFIRRASFDSEATDFGFLVPTPTQPELAESSDSAFEELKRITAPEVITKNYERRNNGGCGCGGRAPDAAGTPAPALEVLNEQRVGGYDAAVLSAEDPDSLRDWLADHGYVFSKDLSEWMDHYVEQKWIITAFKIAKDEEAKAQLVGTSAVRMSFQTGRPFFPYREPDAETEPRFDRLLRIYFIGPERVEGQLGDRMWNEAGVTWAGRMEDDARSKLREQLSIPDGSDPETWWLTEFEDSNTRRAENADVYFSTSEDQSPKKRPPIVQYVSADPGPDATGYLLAATMIGLILWRRLRCSG